MNQLIYQLNKRKLYLQKLLNEIENRMQNLPQGTLRVSKMNGIPRYYHITSKGDTKGKYILKKNKKMAEQLAQKDYMQRVYQCAKTELEDIKEFLNKHDKKELENIYPKLNPYRKELVKPMVISDEEYAAQWEQETFVSNPYHPEEKVYPTKKEEMVRSKSEVMIADMYYELGIPYRYEAEVQLSNGKIKYPDFTLLNIRTREIIYHEHLGLMDDENYRKANLIKLDEYRKNGIYLGKNLIITYEAEGCYLNIKEIRDMCREIIK